MPRRGQRKVMQRNPLLGNLMGKMMSSIFETKKIESATISNISAIFEGRASEDSAKKELAESALKDVVIDILTQFRVDSTLKYNVILIGHPAAPINKNSEYILPPLTDKTLTRIVLVSGTHELFYPSKMTSIMGDESIFLGQGHALEVSSSFGDLRYNDKSYYDKTKHPGKGFKRPENRHLIIVDFVTDDEEIIKKKQGEEIQKAGEKLARSMSATMSGAMGGADANGLIQNLMKNFGSKKD